MLVRFNRTNKCQMNKEVTRARVQPSSNFIGGRPKAALLIGSSWLFYMLFAALSVIDTVEL